jgi:hypothetical protein
MFELEPRNDCNEDAEICERVKSKSETWTNEKGAYHDMLVVIFDTDVMYQIR